MSGCAIEGLLFQSSIELLPDHVTSLDGFVLALVITVRVYCYQNQWASVISMHDAHGGVRTFCCVTLHDE